MREQRILSLSPAVTEIVYALGLDEQVTGVTPYCDYPAAASFKPRVNAGTLDASLLKKLKPTLALSSAPVPPETSAELDRAGVELETFEPQTLTQVFETLRRVGELTGTEENARALVAGLGEGLGAVATRVRGLPRARVYVEEWNTPPSAAGNWVPKLAEFAGSETLLREGEGNREVRLAELLIFNPDACVLALRGAGERADASNVLARKGWGVLRAAREKKVFVVDDALFNRPGPRLAAGCEALARVLHPDAF